MLQPPTQRKHKVKQALILHGTDGKPDSNWFMWLKNLLEARGYDVWVPLLPENHTPNRRTYNEFIFSSGKDFSDGIVVGHSSGAVSVLNMLMDPRCPKVRAAVMVGAWAHNEGTDLDREQFKDLFPEKGFDFEAIRSKAEHMLFLHGDDDPYCPIEQARWLAEQLQADIVVVPGGHHLGAKYNELPVLLESLEQRIML